MIARQGAGYRVEPSMDPRNRVGSGLSRTIGGEGNRPLDAIGSNSEPRGRDRDWRRRRKRIGIEWD